MLAENLVLSGQLLISMIEDLKRNAALKDFAALNDHVAEQDTLNSAQAAQLHAQLGSLQQQLLAQQVDSIKCHHGQDSLAHFVNGLPGPSALQQVVFTCSFGIVTCMRRQCLLQEAADINDRPS